MEHRTGIGLAFMGFGIAFLVPVAQIIADGAQGWTSRLGELRRELTRQQPPR